MRKIVVEFTTIAEIRKLKTVMRGVITSRSDHLPDITRFNLNKLFIPNLVEKAEIHISSTSSTDIVTIGKSSLTFLTGAYPSFTRVSSTSEAEAKYIVLPWSLGNQVGVDNLKNLINRIGSGTDNYTLFFMYVFLKISSFIKIGSMAVIWTDEDQGIFCAIIGFWFGHVAFSRNRFNIVS